MKLSEQISRRQLFVAFGTAQQTGGLTSIDLAASRSADRVTLTASDGSAAPVDAADASAAGVMTAADRVTLEELSSAAFRAFGARSEIPVATIGAGITRLGTAGFSSAGDGGAATYGRVPTEPPHPLKVQSADGAWWELLPDPAGIDMRQAGAVDDDATDAKPALDAILGFTALVTEGVNKALPTIRVSGEYFIGSTVELKQAVRLIGVGSGTTGVKGSKLRFPVNTTGIIVHRSDTIGATTEGTGTGQADGSIIEGLHLVSDGGTIAGITDDAKGHGIWLRARAVLRNLLIADFAGNGVHILAVQTGGAAERGNANLWRVENISAGGNHMNGFFTEGGDANAGSAIGIDARNNGRAGIWDSSFLGNTYVGCHVSGNGEAGRGENGAGESHWIHYNGPGNGNTDRRYVANVAATEAELVATEPGTDATVWIDVGAGASLATVPTWQSGQPEGTYFIGGPYVTDNANAQNVFLNCYSENGFAQYKRPTLVFGGINQGLNAVGTRGGMVAGVNDTQVFGPVTIADGGLDVEGALDTTGNITIGKADPSLEFDDADGTASNPPRITTNENDNSLMIEADDNGNIGRIKFQRRGGGNVARFQVRRSGGFQDIVSGTETSGANQAALTNSTGGTRDGTLAAVSGSGDDATINDNLTDLHALLDEVRTALVAFGIMKGAA